MIKMTEAGARFRANALQPEGGCAATGCSGSCVHELYRTSQYHIHEIEGCCLRHVTVRTKYTLAGEGIGMQIRRYEAAIMSNHR